MKRIQHAFRGIGAAALAVLMMTACAEGDPAESGETEQGTEIQDVRAEPPGGTAAVMDLISGKVLYPDAARKDGVEGKVGLEFTVSETGDIVNILVTDSLHPALDSAAVAAAAAMPAWSPAIQDGKPVATTIKLPIFFKP